MNTHKAFLGCVGLLWASAGAEFQESYSWNFEGGNLLANWSFENLSAEVCIPGSSGGGGGTENTGGTVTECRVKSPNARTGNYVLTVLAKNEGPGGVLYSSSRSSSFLRAEPGTQYTFSYQVKISWNERITSSRPFVCWSREDKTAIGCTQGPAYLATFPNDVTQWTLYSFDFTAPSDGQFLNFHLVVSDNDGVTGQPGDHYEFDDLVIRKTGAPAGIVESRSYANAAGRVDHSIVSDGVKDVIAKIEYDGLGRLHRVYLPVSRQGLQPGAITVSASVLPDLPVDFQSIQEAYVAVAATTSATPSAALPAEIVINAIVANAGDFAALSQAALDVVPMTSSDGISIPVVLQGVVQGTALYDALVEERAGTGSGFVSQGPFTGDHAALLAAQYPGETNLFREYGYPNPGVNTFVTSSLPGSNYGPAAHVQKSGSALFWTPNIPDDPEDNLDLGDATTNFSYSWNRDPQGIYAARIQDERGLTVKTAVSRTAVPESEFDWIVSTADYDDLGRLTTSTTPEGLPTDNFYDGLGRLIQTGDPDRGVTDYLYDVRGNLRFIRTQDGFVSGYFIANKYDELGRFLGRAKASSEVSFDQALADDPSFPDLSGLNEGILYDELDAARFNAATGTTLASLGYAPVLRNTQGKTAVAYNRNLETLTAGITVVADRLVASFNSYDSLGRLMERWKYIGPAPSGKKWHKIKYEYGAQGRLSARTAFEDQTEGVVSTRCAYSYDERGRITQVTDKNNQPLAQYTYDFLDRVLEVSLPGPVNMRYSYDVQGKPRSIEAVANPGTQQSVLFQELLGYEDKPHAGITNSLPAGTQRFDGAISSLVRKFSNTAPNPVEWWQYDYDGPGRMVGSSRNLSTGALGAGGALSFPLTFQSTPATVRDYGYDDDGAISSQSDGAAAYGYNYTAGTHRLDRVSPSFPGRNTSGAGNFQYDEIGRITGDQGSGKSFSYNTADMPTQLTVSGATHSLFYDENNYRVADLEEGASGQILARKVYVYESGLKVVKEIIKRETGHPDGALDLTKVNEYGQSGIVAVGYSSQTDRHVLIKDHQGSVIGAVSVNSLGVLKEQGYLPYGTLQNRVVPASEQAPSWTYTGKEFDQHVNLYYFGARFYDPELGIWLTPDAYGEFFNPYGRGGDPVNFVDPDGNCELVCISIIAGVALGAYFSGSAANNSFNPTKWDYSETWDEILIGGVIGGAAGGLGAWFAAPVSAGGLGWGATAGLVASTTATSLLGSADDLIRGREASGVSTNFGAFDINWGAKNWFDWNNPFDDDPWYENVGDALGWVGNFSDAYALGDRYAWGGKEEGTLVYEPGSEGSGVVNDLESGAKHVGIGGEGHSSHLKLVYEENGVKKAISWGGGQNDITDVAIPPNARTLRVTGLNSSKLTAFGDRIGARAYDWLKYNCGQNVCGAILGGQTSNYFLTPTANFSLLQARQAWRNFYGL